MDIKEIAKGMTRNEFLNSIDKNGRLKYEDKAINCPSNLKLKELGAKCNIRKCQECWEQAVKDIKFKGEDKVEIKDTRKRYSIKEVFEFEEGTRFIDAKTGVVFELETNVEGYADNMKMLINTECDGVVPLSNRVFDKEFIKEGVEIIKQESDKAKELTFKEVIANIKEGETWICNKNYYSIKSISLNSGYIDIGCSNEVENEINIHPDAKFIKEQKPVTFEEVLNSNKKCRVEHEMINTNESILNVPNIMESEWEMYCNGRYLKFGGLMNILGYKYTYGLQEIIKNGKWYIEE